MVSDGFDCVVVSGAITGISGVPPLEAEGLEVDPVCRGFTSDLREDRDYLRCVCAIVVDVFVLLGVKSRLCSLRGAAA